MLGFFDSGLGGLTVLKEVEKELPYYSYIYLGDNARTPYGSRSHETIYKFTKQGVAHLFKKGAQLVILACNTASAAALRRIQQEFLPKHYPDRKVLGIIIPTAEEIASLTKTKEVGILATEATVYSFAYPKEIVKNDPQIKVHQVAGTLLVPIIEAGEFEWEGTDLIIKKYLSELFSKSKKIDTLTLACTHYALIEDKIKKYTPSSVQVVSQGKIVAKKLKEYLLNHPEIESKIAKGGDRIFYSSEDSWRVRNLFKNFYGKPVEVKTIFLR
jgi:glutamate racemase